MSKKGRELATNHYTWERVAQDIKAVWDTVQQLPSPSTQSLEIENDLENETLEANEPTEQVNQDDLNMSSNEAAIEAIHDDDQQTEQPNLQEILTLSSNHEDDNATIHEDEKQTKQPNLQDNLALSSNHKEDNATIHEDEKQTNQSIIEGNLVSPPNNEDYVTIREDKQKTEQQVQKLLNKLKLEKNEELESFVKQHLFQKNELNEYLVTLYQESRSEDKMQEVKVFVEKLTKNVLSLLEMKLKQATEKKVSYTYDANNVSNLKIFTQK
ncbi:hypothetical protein [Alkalihalobacillus hemicellulosilyticus]|uniref:Uncharacterized protein n=1 Tax=Halalkalibacter hemicellulosilyticusJCM 9152 TaxID=1236971 RepID=W4QJW9_9BACI|nr:hypothetical protein [Halalkalibacter hemicellulosilyticus]GAE31649.1 hypothetical protein JCM9152_3130 [Halalkalibacter hemicellulosilyticusJCM 9152]